MATKQSTIVVVTDDNKEYTIRVCGTASDPYFFGKDVCEIMDIKDVKDILQNLVSNDHKKELKILLEEQSNALVPPSWLDGYKPPIFLGEFGLKTLSYHDGRVVVLSEPGIMDLLNGSRKDKNKKILRDAINRFVYTTKYENNSGLIDIFTFSAKEKLALDLTSDWFQDLWYPLSKVNPPPGGGVGRVENRPIILTQNLLEWMGYKGRDQSDKQERFLRLLDSLKIPYTEIDHKHPLAIEYPHVQKEIKLLPKQLSQKKWICMEPRAFKKVVMRLNTENADIVRDYYINLEEAIFAYGEYTMKYMIESTTQSMQYQLAIKDHQLSIRDAKVEEVERLAEEERQRRLKSEIEAKQKLEKALKFNQATKPVEPQEYIYVVTTDRYIPENKYKPGGATSFNLLKSRMTSYNCGKSDSDLHKPVYLRKVVSYRAVEQTLEACLGTFRENANKELYIINFDWLKRCLDAIIDHNEEFLTFVNLNRNQMVEDTLNVTPLHLDPINLESIHISYKRFGEPEVDLTTIFDSDIIDNLRSSLTSFEPNNNVVHRRQFENHLRNTFPSFRIDHNKRKIWEVVKTLGSTIKTNCTFKY